MASVTDAATLAGQAGPALAADGWCFVPVELDRRPWRRLFVEPEGTGRRRAAHLHVITAGNPRWAEQLAFRDALRGDPELADHYAALKRRWVQLYGHDREAYSRAKTDFVRQALDSARRAGG